MQTARQTATLIAVTLKRTGENRVRISEKDVNLLAGRQRLRSNFVVDLKEAVAEHSWSMFELDQGGFGLIKINGLDSAPVISPNKYLNQGELGSVKMGIINFSKFEGELPQTECIDADDGE